VQTAVRNRHCGAFFDKSRAVNTNIIKSLCSLRFWALIKETLKLKLKSGLLSIHRPFRAICRFANETIHHAHQIRHTTITSPQIVVFRLAGIQRVNWDLETSYSAFDKHYSVSDWLSVNVLSEQTAFITTSHRWIRSTTRRQPKIIRRISPSGFFEQHHSDATAMRGQEWKLGGHKLASPSPRSLPNSKHSKIL
jgi:hypothetical protein